MPIIKVSSLTHTYSSGTPFEKTALDNIDLEIDGGEFVGLIGHTGSGKSTFIQHLNGLLAPTSGTVEIDGEDIHSSKDVLRRVRFKVGLVFQYPEYQLFEETVYKDIAFGPKNMGLSDEEIDTRVREAARFAGVDEKWLEVSPLELSGGQKRRVAIAGVIAMRPKVLVLDEPTAGLDPEGRESFLANISAYKEATGATVIIISHSMDDVARIASRLVVFHNGKVALDGTPAEVFDHAEELVDMGLTVPRATQIALALKKRGVSIPESIYTINYLRKLIISLNGEVGE
ncbi:MAG: energy-coupling factor transporter ATPase [Oscillospiraceae bacterium]|nr:energy-coupling factor transporter ATPase [Oscillospiraceae bacterium]MBR5260588.1 energy-coupling factor transporter ATPase [Oscillospiraceae bacterium]